MVMRPSCHVVVTLEQVHHRGLAGTGLPDEGDHLARLNVQIDALDDRLVRLVLKPDILVAHIAAHRPARRRRSGISLTIGLVSSVWKIRQSAVLVRAI